MKSRIKKKIRKSSRKHAYRKGQLQEAGVREPYSFGRFCDLMIGDRVYPIQGWQISFTKEIAKGSASNGKYGT